MNIKATDTLRNRIDNVINIYRSDAKSGKEAELSNVEVMGVLEMVKLDIWRETPNESNGGNDDKDSSDDWKGDG